MSPIVAPFTRCCVSNAGESIIQAVGKYDGQKARRREPANASVDTADHAANIFLSGPTETRTRSTMTIESGIAILGRTLLALLFLFAGAIKVQNPEFFMGRMAGGGVPGFLLPAVIALELGGGLALLLGWKIQYAGGALAIFCVLTAVIFHHDFTSVAERNVFFKDLAIAGALMMIAVMSGTKP
jgi:putative oxidoreductase